MSGYDEHYLDELRERVSVSAAVSTKFTLRRQGTELAAVEDKSITVNDRKRLWYDHGSHKEGGDVFKFFQVHHGLKFPDAVREVARLAGDVQHDNRRNGHDPSPANGKAASTRRKPEGRISEDHDRPAADAARASSGNARGGRRSIVATYQYERQDGGLAYEVVRFDPKGFAQRRKPRLDDPPEDIKQGWVWNLEGIGHSLYRLPKVIEDLKQERQDQLTWFLPEGEKDVHTLEAWDMAATTNSGGAGNFKPELAKLLAHGDIVLIEDNDDAGRKRTNDIAPMLLEHGCRVRVLRVGEIWPECPPKGDITDWKEKAGGDADKLYALVDKLKDWEPPPYQSRFGAKTFSDLGGPAKAYDWTVKGLIPRNDHVLIMGPSQSGKTFKVLDMAMRVVLGKPVDGRKVQQLGGVYLSYEGQNGFENRIRAYAKHNNLSGDDLRHFAWWTRPPGLFATDDHTVKSLAEEIKFVTAQWKHRLGFVVIDTHNSATRGSSEIKSDDISKILTNYDALSEAVGAPLWIIGHSNKDGRHRGNEQIYNRIDTTIHIARVTEGRGESERDKYDQHYDKPRVIRRLTIDKQRDGADHLSVDFCLQEVELGVDEDGDPFRSMVIDEPVRGEGDLGRDNQEIAKPRSGIPVGAWHLTAPEVAFFLALLRALNKSGVEPPTELRGDLPKSITKVVQWKEIGAVYRNQTPNDDETEEGHRKYLNRIKTSMHRARDQLYKRGVVAVAKVTSKSTDDAGIVTARDVHYIWPTGRPVVGPGIVWPQTAAIDRAPAPAAASSDVENEHF